MATTIKRGTVYTIAGRPTFCAGREPQIAFRRGERVRLSPGADTHPDSQGDVRVCSVEGTETDRWLTASLLVEEVKATFKVGDLVRVPKGATIAGSPGAVFFGEAVTAKVIGTPSESPETVHVQRVDGDRKAQYVDVSCLTAAPAFKVGDLVRVPVGAKSGRTANGGVYFGAGAVPASVEVIGKVTREEYPGTLYQVEALTGPSVGRKQFVHVGSLTAHEFKVGDYVKVAGGATLAGDTETVWGDEPVYGRIVETVDRDGDVRVNPAPLPEYYVGASFVTPANEPAKPTVSDFPVGTRVKVSADAKCADGGPVFWGVEVEGEVVESNARFPRDVIVRRDGDLGGITRQYVAPEFLEKLPEAKPEPLAEWERELLEAKPAALEPGEYIVGDAPTMCGGGRVYIVKPGDRVVVTDGTPDDDGDVSVHFANENRWAGYVHVKHLTKAPAAPVVLEPGEYIVGKSPMYCNGAVSTTVEGGIREGDVVTIEVRTKSDSQGDVLVFKSNGCPGWIGAKHLTKVPAKPATVTLEALREAAMSDGWSRTGGIATAIEAAFAKAAKC